MMSYIFNSCKKCSHWKNHDCEIPVKERTQNLVAVAGMLICPFANKLCESEEERIERERLDKEGR